MTDVIAAIEALYSSTDRQEKQKADKWLREWQKKNEAWGMSDALLNNPKLEQHVWQFATQTLRNKILFDFDDLSEDLHESFCQSILVQLRKFSSMRSISTLLSLCLCDLSVRISWKWGNPVDTFFQFFNENNVNAFSVNEHTSILLMLLKHLPEENRNRHLMVDTKTREKHAEALLSAFPKVTTYLANLRMQPNYSAVKIKALSCWYSWLSFKRAYSSSFSSSSSSSDSPSSSANKFDYTSLILPLVQDCFQIIEVDTDTEEYDNGESVKYVCTECIYQIIRIIEEDKENEYADIITYALNKCTNELVSAVERAYKNEDVDTLQRLYRIYSFLGILLIDKILHFIHTDIPLQLLVKTLLKFMQTTNNIFDISDDGGEDNVDAALGDVLFFWEKLTSEYIFFLQKIKKQSNNEEKINENALNIKTLNEIYDNLCLICIDCITECDKGLHCLLFNDFEGYRRRMFDCLLDCVAIIGHPKILNIVLSKFSLLLNSNKINAQKFLRNFLYIIINILKEVEVNVNETNAMESILCTLVDALIAQQQPPMDLESAADRLAIIDFIGCMYPYINAKPDLYVEKVMQSLMCQLKIDWTASVEKNVQGAAHTQENNTQTGRCFQNNKNNSNTIHSINDYDENNNEKFPMSHAYSEIAVHTACTVRTLCCRCKCIIYMPFITQQLCDASIYKGGVNEEAFSYLLEGVVSLISRIPDTPKFLQLLGVICEPLIDSLRHNKNNPPAIGAILDHLSVLIRDITVCVESDKARGEAVCTFITGTVYPMIEELMVAYRHNDKVIEKCGRCLKHSVRCIPYAFKFLLPKITLVLIEGSQVEMQPTYLYAAEWLAKKYCDDKDTHQYLDQLFQHFSRIGLNTIQQKEKTNQLRDHPELLEDFFGMNLRYLKFCPHIAAKSDALHNALLLARASVHEQHKGVVSALFAFLDCLIAKCKTPRSKFDGARTAEELAEETALINTFKALVERHMGDIFKEIIKMVVSVPPYYVLGHVESVLDTALRYFPAESRQWLQSAFEEVPHSIIPSAAVKTEILEQIFQGDDALCMALEDFAYQSERVFLRTERA